MRVHFTSSAWEDFVAWNTQDPAVARKILELIDDIRRSPFKGLGKPEPLKGDWQHWWSRRVNHRDRLVYTVQGKAGDDQHVVIGACREHY